MTDEQLKKLFSNRFGEVASAFSIEDESGKSKGYGFLDFINKKDAEEVITQKKIMFKGKIMIAKKFEHKTKSPSLKPTANRPKSN